jgi:hypothetical protein
VPHSRPGIDLTALSPPLSLLQGFNATSEEGLNNIIAVTDEILGHSHPLCFKADDYRDICGAAGQSSSTVLGEYGALIDSVHAKIEETELSCNAEEALDVLSQLLDREGMEYNRGKYVVDLYGMSFSESRSIPKSVNVQIDPGVADAALSLVSKVFGEFRKEGVQGATISLLFIPAVQCIQDRFRVTGRILGTGVKMAGEKN